MKKTIIGHSLQSSPTPEEVRNRIHNVVVGALSDEGVFSFDQVTAIGRAIMGAVDVLLTGMDDG